MTTNTNKTNRETEIVISQIALGWLKKHEMAKETITEIGECLFFNKNRMYAIKSIAIYLKDKITGNVPDIMHIKLLEASLHRVDWVEVAEQLAYIVEQNEDAIKGE